LEIVERDKGKYRFVTLDYIEKRKNVVNWFYKKDFWKQEIKKYEYNSTNNRN
jgi:hypothetical protein